MAEGLIVAEQLDSATDERVVTAHPAAIKNYLDDIERMREALENGEALEDEKETERPELITPYGGSYIASWYMLSPA
jgi:predicted regulator of Ras-like GTPase activity (Roadblock/LC7/MglB family)